MQSSSDFPMVVALVEIREPDGRQRWVPYYATGSDHKAAAEQAFEGIASRGTIVSSLTTFDGPGRQWDPRHGVTERT